MEGMISTLSSARPLPRLTIAYRYSSELFSVGEVDAARALMALLLLEVPEAMGGESHRASQVAAKLLQSLARRAVRSFHVEVIENRWKESELKSALLGYREWGLWTRLRRYEALFSKEIRRQEARELHVFCNEIEVRTENSALRGIAQALRASVGVLGECSALMDQAPVCAEIVDIARPLRASANRPARFLRPVDWSRLRNLLETHLLQSGRQVTLLAELPPIEAVLQPRDRVD
jgi:hypothetical protein